MRMHIAGIDLLRFLGAVSVILTHLHFKENVPQSIAWLFDVIHGERGVLLFYVISGFLITWLIAREVVENGQFDIGGFYIRRIWRIFPLYYLVLACYATISAIGIENLTLKSFSYASIYIYNFIPKVSYQSWIGSLHTLATEEHFYLLYPIVWFVALRTRVPIWSILAIMIGMTFLTLELSRPFAKDFFISRWTFNAWGSILIGCLFGLYLAAAPDFLHKDRPTFLVLAIAFVGVGGVAGAAHSKLLMAIGFGFLLLHIAYNQKSRWISAQNAKPFRWMGNISYGLYLWQSLIISTGSAALISNKWLAMATVFMLATLSYIYFERPIMSFSSRLRAERRTQEVTSSGTQVSRAPTCKKNRK